MAADLPDRLVTEAAVAAPMTNLAETAFTFVEAIKAIDTADSLLDVMRDAFGTFGFDHFVIASLPRAGQASRQAIHMHRVPAQWYDLYTRANYMEHDPVVRHCRASVHPFEWKDVPIDLQAQPKAREVMTRAHDFRMEQGFCLPVHGIDGVDGCISLSGRDVELTPETKPAIHLMALYAFDRGREIARDKMRSTIQLSPREIEILSFSASGYSASAIAKRLGITERTVTAHITNACCKLDASNKTQAVARAVQLRFVSV
ncbi:MAG: LuxR family transcriptional regulator [Salinarimonas sp.]